MKKIAVMLLVSAALLGGCTRTDQAEGLPDGAAPDFTLMDLAENKVSLSDMKGKVVLLEFWATWCPPCRASAPGIEKLYTAYAGRGFTVLGISLDSDDWDSVRSFAKEYGISYPILMGTEKVADRYKVKTIPLFVLIDREGKIRRRYLGSGNEESIEEDMQSLLGS